MEIAPNSRVLFQGDSITDADRNRRQSDSLGEGYAMMVASWLSAKYPEKRISFLNRGISGDTVIGLRERWQQDCINLRPDVVSILIGINDVLERFFWNGVLRKFWNNSTSNAQFEIEYRAILDITRRAQIKKVVIMAPFALKVMNNFEEVQNDLKIEIDLIRNLSTEFSALLIPLNDIFEAASEKREPTFWSLDGVHPTRAGHALIAQSWLKAVIGDSLC